MNKPGLIHPGIGSKSWQDLPGSGGRVGRGSGRSGGGGKAPGAPRLHFGALATQRWGLGEAAHSAEPQKASWGLGWGVGGWGCFKQERGVGLLPLGEIWKDHT